MMNPASNRIALLAPRTSPNQALHWMIRAVLVWLFVYLVLQGQDGFFARTADRVESLWVQLVFLNLPLQILLTLAAIGCAVSNRPPLIRIGFWLAALTSLLILVHIALSVATA